MEEVFLILVCLVGGLQEAEAMSVTGVLLEDISIECVHSNAISNIKYFCRGNCADEDVLITSSETDKDSQGKYRIKDEGNTFFVTIKKLTENDSGLYWCGIERVGVDTYNRVDLTVTKGDGADLQSFPETLVYIGVGLGVVVLALAAVLLIFFKYRNRDISSSLGKDNNTVYATPCRQGARHITASSLRANEDEDRGTRANSVSSSAAAQHQDVNRDQEDIMSPEARSQPADLFYSSVSFTKHAESSTATPCSAEVTYSTIADVSKDESAVYCNISG